MSLKCYSCGSSSCGSDIGKEEDCELASNTTRATNEFRLSILAELGVNREESGLAAEPITYVCAKIEQKDGWIYRACTSKKTEEQLKKEGVKCNVFAEGQTKIACFCSTDLCNEAPKVIGNSKPLAFLSVFAFVSTYSSVNLFI
ncbi:unnamed protein product [Orchesella dallaii]|uniref:Protein sleepless n=1 Tax=Orchesella dallaii TaxID=48710 RepID=A0ABP1Q3H9_9HEXA